MGGTRVEAVDNGRGGNVVNLCYAATGQSHGPPVTEHCLSRGVAPHHADEQRLRDTPARRHTLRGRKPLSELPE